MSAIQHIHISIWFVVRVYAWLFIAQQFARSNILCSIFLWLLGSGFFTRFWDCMVSACLSYSFRFTQRLHNLSLFYNSLFWFLRLNARQEIKFQIKNCMEKRQPFITHYVVYVCAFELYLYVLGQSVRVTVVGELLWTRETSCFSDINQSFLRHNG